MDICRNKLKFGTIACSVLLLIVYISTYTTGPERWKLDKVFKFTQHKEEVVTISSCEDASSSGVYHLEAQDVDFDVYCQVDTLGRWIVIQRRQDGSEDFAKRWEEYKNGFGCLNREFWIGNEVLYTLTKFAKWKLRIDLEDWENNKHTLYYDTFSVGKEETGYELKVLGFKGKAPPGDSMASANGMKFTTIDRDNDLREDGNCAVIHTGAWWHGSCHLANPNGSYNHTAHGNGLNWASWKGYAYSLKSISMMIR